MTFFTLQVVIEKEPGEEEFVAYSPTLPGCFSRGRSVEDAQEAIRTSLSNRLRDLLSRGEPLPASRKFLRVEDVTIALAEEDRSGAEKGEDGARHQKKPTAARRSGRP